MCADDQVRHVNLRVGQEQTIEEGDSDQSGDGPTNTHESSSHGVISTTTSPIQSTLLWDFSAERYSLCSLGVSPPLYFLGEQYGTLFIRHLRAGKQVAQIRVSECQNSIVNAITFMRSPLEEESMPDGTRFEPTGQGTQRFIVACNDATARMYDMTTFARVSEFKQSVPINYACGSPDGRQVVLACDSFDAYLCDAATAQPIASLAGHQGDIFSASFHSTRPLVATAGQDNTTRVFDLRRSGKALYVLPGKMSPIRSVQFDRSGEMLVMTEGETMGEQAHWTPTIQGVERAGTA